MLHYASQQGHVKLYYAIVPGYTIMGNTHCCPILVNQAMLDYAGQHALLHYASQQCHLKLFCVTLYPMPSVTPEASSPNLYQVVKEVWDR